MINGTLKEIAKIQGPIELSNLNYSTRRNNYNFNKYFLPIVLFKKLYNGSLTSQAAAVKQSLFATEPQKCKKGRIPDRKKNFLRKAGLRFIEGDMSLMLLRVVE